MLIIDTHIHCGIQNVSQPFSDIEPLLDRARIQQACLFAPVEDIYYRYTSGFDDNEHWAKCRAAAHEYLLELAGGKNRVHPYYFVWNDFRIDDLIREFQGIKWHHHSGEPSYNYEDPRCDLMIDAICERRLPVVLEETLSRTVEFVSKVDGRTTVIIPHLGFMNGGFDSLARAGIWDLDFVCADTALAGRFEISTFLERHGPDRLIFGSDYPFGTPGQELDKLVSMDLPQPDLEKILSGNILRLFDRIRQPPF